MVTLEDFVAATEKGKFFHVVFTKRTTNERRDMTCRCGVRNRETGGGLMYDPAKKNLLSVFDTKADAYRQVPLDGLRTVRVHGVEYDFDPATQTFHKAKVDA